MIAVAAAPSAQLTVSVVEDAAALAELRDDWLALQQRSNANEPMLSPTWLLTWWRLFGEQDGRRLRIVLFRQGERLVGLAPLLRRPFRHCRFLRFRRLESLGTGEAEEDSTCPDYLNILAERGAESAVASAFVDVLANGAAGAWDELVIPKMDGEDDMPGLLADALNRSGIPTTLENTAAADYIPLPTTWDAYLKALPSSRR